LAPRHAELMKLLAKQQIANSEKEDEKEGGRPKALAVGMEYREFKKEAQAKLLVTSDTQLQQFLVELRAHALVHTKRNDDGVEFISIPHPPGLVAMIGDFNVSGAK